MEEIFSKESNGEALPVNPRIRAPLGSGLAHPCQRFAAIEEWCSKLSVQRVDNADETRSDLSTDNRDAILKQVSDILWQHADILPEHLDYTRGIVLVDEQNWLRSQQWDNILSFYDPEECLIVIREDQTRNTDRFGMAFLVALGQSLLGNYAEEKIMEDVQDQGENIGRIYRLTVRKGDDYQGFFSVNELEHYMELARMRRSAANSRQYTRLVNSEEGFTPPGLLFGLFYTWYLDNRFAGHIEYKMSIMRNVVSDLIPEQVKIVERRKGLVDFFREKVFRHTIILENPTD